MKPLLKWAGGKRRLVETLFDVFPSSFDFQKNSYFEPFIGGGAVFFALASRLSSTELEAVGRRAHSFFLSDTNDDLINFYKVVREDPAGLIKKMRAMSLSVKKADFLNVRCSMPKGRVERAARLLYLNRLCFNGLYRVNSKGEFNVPFGSYKNPKIFDKDQILACSQWLKKSILSTESFKSVVTKTKKGDLVYFDPPYIPLSVTSSFSSYAKEGFGEHDQRDLAKVIETLTKKGVLVVLSNSDTKLSREIFGGLDLYSIAVRRSISADGAKRREVKELIGTNYPLTSMSQPANLRRLRVS